MEENKIRTMGDEHQEKDVGGGRNVVHTRQLDYLYWQLDGLKQSMKEKQSCLANIIDVQKKMIKQQNFMILDLNDKIKQDNIDEFENKKDEQNKQNIIVESVVKSSTAMKDSSKKFCELYQRASENKKDNDDENDYEDIIDDDDNDSFITIDTDDDIESDDTLENSGSSDSGYTEYNDNPAITSYGINPLFAHQDHPQTNDGTEACQDFVFFNQKKETLHRPTQLQTIPEKETRSGTEKEEELQKKDDRKEWTGSLRRSHRIVIINNESALVCNES